MVYCRDARSSTKLIITAADDAASSPAVMSAVSGLRAFTQVGHGHSSHSAQQRPVTVSIAGHTHSGARDRYESSVHAASTQAWIDRAGPSSQSYPGLSSAASYEGFSRESEMVQHVKSSDYRSSDGRGRAWSNG